jgi:phage head maturation protease
MKLFLPLAKIETEERKVFGYASTEALDSHGEIVKREALAAALPDYMRFANIREMHQMSAVGVASSATIDATGLMLSARVVDDDAWNKVKEGVYKGFSIGGEVNNRDPDNPKIITGVRLTEISLVDRPANPEAVFQMFKADGGTATDSTLRSALQAALSAITAIAAILANSGGAGDGSDDGCDDDDDFDDGDDIGKAVRQGQLTKTGVSDKLTAELAGLRKELTRLRKERTELNRRIERLETEPAPVKGALRVVGKDADQGGGPDPYAKALQALPADASPEERATALIKVSLTQPMRLGF